MFWTYNNFQYIQASTRWMYKRVTLVHFAIGFIASSLNTLLYDYIYNFKHIV